VTAIHRAFDKLMADPTLGRRFPNAPKETHRYHVGSHVVFYRRTRTRFYIVRVLHQSMDHVRHLR
jgi:plasmid stabilization system protein ParE